MTEEREQMHFDVVVVGAGPSGLATAIRLKQVNPDLTVVVIEKGAEVGAHILSGAVIDPAGLTALLPDWKAQGAPLDTPVTEDRFHVLTERSAFSLPGFIMPPLMSNHGCYVGSLGRLCQWLAQQAEALGVEIYPGFAGTELLLDDRQAVIGVATGDAGITRAREPGPAYTRGMALLAKYVVLAEGVRGSLSKTAIARFGLAAGADFQKYGIGFKEVWEVPPELHRPGLVQHSFGWPLDGSVGGGSFLYHYGDNLVSVGFVVHLNYANPHLSPFGEFQRFKTHSSIRPLLERGKRLSYGARAISEGGFQSIPRLAFPGGVLVGDSAGFVNLPRIKGSHNAIQSGILTAEHVAAAIAAGRGNDVLEGLDDALRKGPVGKDLRPVRNVKPLWSRFGTLGGIVLGGFDMWCQTVFGVSPFGTLAHRKPDHACLEPQDRHQPIAYPAPDGVVSFDRLSSVYVSGTNHAEDQPPHLHVGDMELQRQSELGVYGGPSTRYCPAGVYEWLPDGETMRYQINAQNCVHCKTCDIKDPNQNIDWVPPEGAGGPNYAGM